MRRGGELAKAIAAGADVADDRIAAGPRRGGARPRHELGDGRPVADAAARDADPGRDASGSLERILLGPAHVTDGSENLVGALRQSMAALGARTIREMQRVEMVYAPSTQTEGKSWQREPMTMTSVPASGVLIARPRSPPAGRPRRPTARSARPLVAVAVAPRPLRRRRRSPRACSSARRPERRLDASADPRRSVRLGRSHRAAAPSGRRASAAPAASPAVLRPGSRRAMTARRWRTTWSPPAASSGSRRAASSQRLAPRGDGRVRRGRRGSRGRSSSPPAPRTRPGRATCWPIRAATCGSADRSFDAIAEPLEAGRPRAGDPRADPALRDAGREPRARTRRSGSGRPVGRVRPSAPRMAPMTVQVEVETTDRPAGRGRLRRASSTSSTTRAG